MNTQNTNPSKDINELVRMTYPLEALLVAVDVMLEELMPGDEKGLAVHSQLLVQLARDRVKEMYTFADEKWIVDRVEKLEKEASRDAQGDGAAQ